MFFRNALNKVSFFAQKPTSPRGMPFSFELSKDLKIDLQMYVKISEENLKIKFQKVTGGENVSIYCHSECLNWLSSFQVDKVREYEEVKDEMKAEVDEADLEPGGAEDYGKISKGDLIKGYHYGTSIIPFDDAAKEMAAIEKGGKCLKLIQFTKKHNVSLSLGCPGIRNPRSVLEMQISIVCY